MFSLDKQHRIKIADIVPNEFEDFLTYCSIANKIFPDEITSVDFIAYRSQFGREKSEVKRLRALIESGEAHGKSDISAEKIGLAPKVDVEVLPLNHEIFAKKQNLGNETKSIDKTVDMLEKIGLSAYAPKSNNVFTNSENTYAEILGINADDYADISVELDLRAQYSVDLSIRSLNALRNAKCLSLKDLLLLTPLQLPKIKNLGAKSVKEIESVLLDISKQLPSSNEQTLPEGSCSIRKKVLYPIIESMLHGEPYSEAGLTEDEKGVFAEAVEAAELLGNDFCIELMVGKNHQYIKNIIKAFMDFNYNTTLVQSLVDSAKSAVATWKSETLSNWLLPYLQLFCMSQKKKVSDEFKSLFKQDVTVAKYAELLSSEIDSNTENLTNLAKELEAFQNWMGGVDLPALCKKAFSPNMSMRDRIFDVLTLRAAGHTLEEIAQQYGLTRERVRQIEKRGLYNIKSRLSNSKYDLIALVSAYRNGDHILLKNEVAETIGSENADLLWYCATRTEDKGRTYFLDSKIVHYDSTHNAIFVFYKETQEEFVAISANEISEALINSLPDLIETSTLKEELKSLAIEHGLLPELFILEAAKQYKEAGIYSYKGRLTVVQMCDFVLKKRFQNGYKISDETDSGLFMKYLVEFFGEKGQMTARAIDAKVMDLGVLIDRGKYVHKDYISVDRSVVDEIFAYIESSPKTALAYFEIFAALEELLKGTAITNRYALQGVMKLYGCPYASHRDYISKDRDGNVADELNAFVETNGLVHKAEIFAEFPGWKDYNLAFVLPRCPEVIGIDNGYFMHASKLVISEDTRCSIRKYLDANIQDIPVSARYLQDAFMLRFPEFMIKNDIQTHGKLFGIIQYMFPKAYHFSRPYIAKENIGEITNKSVLLKHLEGIKSIDLSDLIDLCKENAVHYVSVSYLLDMMQPEFVRIDSHTLMRFEDIGFNEEMYLDVSDIISETVAAHNGYIAAGSIFDFSWYPVLNIPWTPFLLESIANMIPGGINTIKMVSLSSEVPHAIFVSDEYADDDWNSLLVKLLKAEHAIEPFTTKTAILEWLQAEGLCNIKYPTYLDTEKHVFFDDSGSLRIE